MSAETQQQLSMGLRAIICGLAAVMIAVSGYLTAHFYDVHFPAGYSSGAFCDISGFWNCDVATLSRLGHVFYVPTAMFGLVWGVLLFVSTLLRRAILDRTNYILSWLNALGCLGLLGYSLLILRGLCPGCVVYYSASFLTLAAFGLGLRKSITCSPRIVGLYSLVMILTGGGVYLHNETRFTQQEDLSGKAVERFLASPRFDVYKMEPAHYFQTGVEVAARDKAPLQILLFSDYECPACQLLADMIPKLIARYWGKLSLGYVYFPLDASCNPFVSSKIHPHACLAARLSYCGDRQFDSLHDHLYASQRIFSPDWFDEQTKELGLGPCFYADSSLTAVRQIIEATKPFEINATPTLIVNGRKIDGLLPIKFLYTLIDGALAASEQPLAAEQNVLQQ